MLLIFFLAPAAFAQPYESIDDMKKFVSEFVAKNISVGTDEKMDVQVNQTEAMQMLAKCSIPLEMAFPGEGNKEQATAIELKCNGTQAWHTLVPVNIVISTKVLVAKHMIPANQVIAADDVDYAMYDRNRLYNGYFAQQENVIGQVASQVIAAGMVLNKRNLQQPVVIHRNQVIDLVARSNAVTVTMKGIAKSDGRLNEVIQAFNPSSKRTLDAVVIEANRAEVVS